MPYQPNECIVYQKTPCLRKGEFEEKLFFLKTDSFCHCLTFLGIFSDKLFLREDQFCHIQANGFFESPCTSRTWSCISRVSYFEGQLQKQKAATCRCGLTELKILVEVVGFEPATFCLQSRHSTN